MEEEGGAELNKKEKEEKSKKGEEAVSINVRVAGNGGENSTAEKKPEGKPELSLLEKAKVELEEKKQEVSDYLDKWLRLRAEFENFKKRMQKEKDDFVKYGNENLLKALLPVLDNLNRAIDHGRNSQGNSGFLEGVELVRKQFLSTLERFGVKPVPSTGEEFDPEKHEALSQTESDLPPNRVVSTVEEGFFYYDRLLRPAKVIVSKGKPG